MAVGFEPTTQGFSGPRSTAELRHAHYARGQEGGTSGTQKRGWRDSNPQRKAFQAFALPLSYTRDEDLQLGFY